ncbi:2-ketoaldonate reductase/glyoxylate reductase B [Escherichia coli]|uniref:2-ketoaldonate reductase/glyoxylate reductase B n=1 Tax=Escherichia coli TaxID=562 RepID=A0A376VCI0_ECOLX|nr:2-ketoaldonate reductase/glyoxylate reductase B [Escherichia coli]
MKPSVILYKALPDDLLQRLQEHFTVHQVANLSPQPSNKMQQFLPKLKVYWVQTRMLMPHCWKNAETACHINDLCRL